MSAELWVVESKRVDIDPKWFRPIQDGASGGIALAERMLRDCRKHASEGVEYRICRYIPAEAQS